MDKKEWLQQMISGVADPGSSFKAPPDGGVERTVTYQGIPLGLEQYAGSKNSLPSLEIRLQLSFPCLLEVRSEMGIDRMGKAIGLAYETQSGDQMFDQKYYVECEHRSFAEPFLLSRDHRDAASQLLQEIPHARSVSGDNNGVTLRIQPFKEDQFNSTHLAQALPLLKKFGSEIPQMPPFPRRIHPFYMLLIIDFLFLAIGIAAFHYSYYRYQTLDNMFIYSLRYSIPAFIAFVALAFAMLRGRSRAAIRFMTITLSTFISFLFLSYGGTIFFNCYFDKSSPVENIVSVFSKRMAHGRKSDRYYVSVTSWRGKSRYEEMKVDSGEYNGVNPGDRLRIMTRKGRLGLEWIVSWKKG